MLYFVYTKMKGDGKLSPRTGRPTNNPKENYTGIRLSDDELYKIKFCMEQTGTTKTDIIRNGINKIYDELQNFKERRDNMYSFRDINDNNIPFGDLQELDLETQTDIVTDEVTAYLVNYNDQRIEVTEETYNAIKNKK